MSHRARKLVVAALARNPEGKILLSRRRPNQPLPNLWELPGGKIEPGEAPEHALEREIQEEIGCVSEIGPIYDVVFHAYPDFDLYMLVYETTLQGEPSCREVAEVAWVEPLDVPEMDLLPADYPLARRLAREAATPR